MTLWTPAQIKNNADIYSWLDLSDSANYTLNSNGKYVSAVDKSGKGNNMGTYQSQVPNQTTINGLKAMAGDARYNLCPYINNGTFSSSYFGFVMLAVDNGGQGAPGYRLMSAGSQGTDASSASQFNVNFTDKAGVGLAIGADGVQATTSNPAVNVPFVLTGAIGGTTISLSVNGGQTSTSATTPAALTPNWTQLTFLGAQNNNYSYSSIGEMIFFKSAPTADEIARCEGYLAWKWGTQAALPNTHPYYAAAPTLVTLNTLVLSTTGAVAGNPFEAIVSGQTSGTTLALTNNVNGKYSLSGNVLNGTGLTLGTDQPQITETYPVSTTATNSPNVTTFNVTIATTPLTPIYSEIQRHTPSSPYVELWQLDTTIYGGIVYYFVVANVLNSTVSWNGITYQPFDIQASGFDRTTQGTVPTPKLSMSTTNSALTGLINGMNDLLGCKVTRIRTFYKFLDGQSAANPSEYLAKDVFVINTKSAENKMQVDFELTSYMDQRFLQLPFGTVTTYCRAIYRKSTGTTTGNPLTDFTYNPSDVACPYRGTSYWDANDNPLSGPVGDACSHQESGCRLRFGTNNEIPIMAFPGSAAPSVGA